MQPTRTEKDHSKNNTKFVFIHLKCFLYSFYNLLDGLTGLNFISPRFQQEWRKGGRHRDLAIARLSLGSSLLAGGYLAADSGRITGSGPGDTNERNNLRQLGWQEFSFVFGFNNLTNIHH